MPTPAAAARRAKRAGAARGKAGHPGDHVQAGVRAAHDHAIPERASEGVQQGRASLAVPGPRPPHVSLEGARRDELRERLLLEPRTAAVAQDLGAGERLDQRRGQDEVADPQRGEHHLRQRAQVEDVLAGIERLQRRNGTTVEPVLAVVVVLEDPCAGAPCPGEERHASRPGHHRAERILVRRRGDHEAHAGSGKGGRIEAVVVDGDRRQSGAAREHGVARALEPGLLHHHAVAAIDEEARREIEALLRAGDDHDLLRPAVHAACTAEVVRESGAQRGRSLRRAVVVFPRSRAAGAAAETPAPGGGGEVGHRRQAVAEVPAQRLARGGVRALERQAAALEECYRESSDPRTLTVGRLRGRSHGRRGGPLHVGAGSAPAGEIALRRELIVGEQHGRARHAELHGERPGRGQASAHREAAGDDPVADRAVDLMEEPSLSVEVHWFGLLYTNWSFGTTNRPCYPGTHGDGLPNLHALRGDLWAPARGRRRSHRLGARRRRRRLLARLRLSEGHRDRRRAPRSGSRAHADATDRRWRLRADRRGTRPSASSPTASGRSARHTARTRSRSTWAIRSSTTTARSSCAAGS